MSTLPPLHGGYRPRAEATRSPTDPPPVAPSGRGAASASLDRCDCDRWHSKHRWHCATNYSEGVGTGAGEGATGQDTGTARVTRSEDCPEAPAQAHPLGPDGFTPLAPESVENARRAEQAERRAEDAEAEVERLRDVLAEVRRAFDLQCPPMPADQYVDRGAWMAHSWWNTVLGGILNREAQR